MTASEMRAIAHKNGNFDEEVKKYTSYVEDCKGGKSYGLSC